VRRSSVKGGKRIPSPRVPHKRKKGETASKALHGRPATILPVEGCKREAGRDPRGGGCCFQGKLEKEEIEQPEILGTVRKKMAQSRIKRVVPLGGRKGEIGAVKGLQVQETQRKGNSGGGRKR